MIIIYYYYVYLVAPQQKTDRCYGFVFSLSLASHIVVAMIETMTMTIR